MDTTLFDTLSALPADYPGISKIPDDIIYLMNCGSFSQFCCTLRGMIDHDRFCPFCPTEMTRRKRKLDHDGDRWMLLQNEFVQKGVENMKLIIPKRHIELPDFTAEDWAEIGHIFSICRTSYGMTDGGILMRFGSVRYHAGTIKHGHINVTRPIPGTEHRPTLAKDDMPPPDQPEKWTHLRDFARLRINRAQLLQVGGRNWLFSQEGIEETQPKVAA